MTRKSVLIVVGLVLFVVTLVLFSIYAAVHDEEFIDKVRTFRTYVDYGALAFIVIALCVVILRTFRGTKNDNKDNDDLSDGL